MPEKSTLRIDGIGLTSPNRDVVTGTAKDGTTDTAPYGKELFVRTATITSAGAGALQVMIPDAEVGAGRKVYITNAYCEVQDSTAWTTANSFALLSIQPNNTTYTAANRFVHFTQAALTGFSKLWGSKTGVEAGPLWTSMIGGPAGVGVAAIGLTSAGPGVPAVPAGSNVKVTIVGYIG